MRLLAALTLFISVSISSFSFADSFSVQPEWEYEVNPAHFLRGSNLQGINYISSNDGGGCVVSLSVTDQNNNSIPFLFVLNSNGELVWGGRHPLRHAPRIILNTPDRLVFREGNIAIRTVCLLTGQEEIHEQILTVHSSRSRGRSDFFFVSNGHAIQKWGPSITSPQLAGSSFGIDDGNLIISWPTTAGQTYQVQRSTDLQSWENIGVALTGNGTTMSYSQPSNAAKVFLRVVIP